MKKFELRRLVAKYKEIKIKLSKSNNGKLIDKLKLIEHRCYHETSKILKSDLEEIR